MNIILLGIGHVKQSENENTGYKRGQKYLSICSGIVWDMRGEGKRQMKIKFT